MPVRALMFFGMLVMLAPRLGSHTFAMAATRAETGPERLLLRVSEAAALTGVSRTTAYDLIAKGEWPTVRVGTAVRVVLTDLRAWVDSNKTRAQQ